MTHGGCNWAGTAAALLALSAVLASADRAGAGVTLVRADQELIVIVKPAAIDITYTIGINREAAFFESVRMDADCDGKISELEKRRYFSNIARSLARGIDLKIDGRYVKLPEQAEVHLSVLQGGRVLQKLYRYQVPLPPDWATGTTIELHDDNYLDYTGNVLVTIDPGDCADVTYDSRWGHEDEDTVAGVGAVVGFSGFGARYGGMRAGVPDICQRDVTFRIRKGTGNAEMPADYRPDEGGTLGNADDDRAASLAGGTTISRPGAGEMLAVVVAVIAACAAIITWAVRRRCPRLIRGLVASGGVAAFALAGAAWVLCDGPRGPKPLDDVAARQIFQRLHRQIYAAFNERSEAGIYDRLARGLSGPILDEVYNEVYQSMVARSEGLVNFRIRRIKPLDTRILPAAPDEPAGSFRVWYQWRVYGTVTHVGHTHARFNEYQAQYEVEPTPEGWRIAGSKVWQKKRVRIGES